MNIEESHKKPWIFLGNGSGVKSRVIKVYPSFDTRIRKFNQSQR